MHSLINQGASKIGSVIGFDPGSNHLGMGVIELDVVSLEIQRTYANTFSPEKYVDSVTVAETHGDRYSRIFKLSEIILAELIEIKPIAIVCEAPFISRLRPMAYGALVEVCYAVRQAVNNYSATEPLYLIDPPRAKQAVGAKHNAQKEEVLAALLAKAEELKFDSSASKGRVLKDIDEHSSDGIAIAYSMINNYRGTTCLF